jgi:predicted metal-dependent hydrolase
MSRKKANAKLYMNDKVKWVKGELTIEQSPEDYLYANGIYPTKILPEDLPEWYVFGYIYKRHGYLSAKGVKHLQYVPNFTIKNHLHKYDTLYISYDKPIEPYENEGGSIWYKGYDDAVGSHMIADFAKAAGKYSDYDVKEILSEIERKRAWYYENNPESRKRAEILVSASDEDGTDDCNIAPDFGRRLPYRGNEYILGGCGGKKSFFDNAFCVPVKYTTEQIKAACVKIYRDLARHDLAGKVRKYAVKMGIEPNEIKISGTKVPLGSCSENKVLTFSWRLVMGKEEVIDYVVVSALAQIKEPSRSPNFWSIVESVLPDYKERRDRLRYFIEQVKSEDWI